MKIKICHFVNNITGKSDGVLEHIRMISRYSNPEYFGHYLVYQGSELIEKEMKTLDIETFIIPSLNKKVSIKSFILFYSFCKSNKIDIIHTHTLKPYSIGGIANIFLKKKLIFNFHGLFINNKYNSRIEKLIYKFFHKVITFYNAVDYAIVPSASSKEILYRETNLFPKILVYYNGYGQSNGILSNQLLIKEIIYLKYKFSFIAIIARFNIEKRIDIALRIFKKVTELNPNVFLFLFGNGPLEYEMKRLAYDLKIYSKILFLGFIPDVKNYIKYFDLTLFTSDWEGLPLTLWESMAAGVPVVSTDVGGMKEILLRENCGLIFPKGSIEIGAKKIIDLLNDKKKRDQFGENGKKAIKNIYNSEKFGEYFNKLYLELSAGI